MAYEPPYLCTIDEWVVGEEEVVFVFSRWVSTQHFVEEGWQLILGRVVEQFEFGWL